MKLKHWQNSWGSVALWAFPVVPRKLDSSGGLNLNPQFRSVILRHCVCLCVWIPLCSYPDSPGSWCPAPPCRLADSWWLSDSRSSLVGWSVRTGFLWSTEWTAAWSPPHLQTHTQPYTHTLTVKAVCKISPPELGAQDCERFVVALVALLFLHPISPMQSAQEQNLSEEVQIIYKIVAAGQRNSKH